MKRLPRRNTVPELTFRRALHRRGVRFRLHRADLPGRPDVVLVRLHVVVFIDGCFWHGCPDHAVQPKANASFWRAKIDTNRERDRRKDTALRALGWEPLHVWEHEDPEVAAQRVALMWRRGSRSALTPPSPSS